MSEHSNLSHDPAANAVGVEATVDVAGNNVPPRLTFSFAGLNDPIRLWQELESLGWIVPERPPAPAPVINWDTVDYSPPAYRVEDFVVSARPWNPRDVPKKALVTINTLRRFGVDLDIPISYLDFLRRTQLSLAQSPAQTASDQPEPVAIPNIVLLSSQPWGILFQEPTIDVFETAVTSGATTWTWSESPLQPGELGSGEQERRDLLEAADFGWELESRSDVVPTALDGRDRTLRFLCRDITAGTDMFDQFRTIASDQCIARLMRPIRTTGARENCLLVVAVVPSERFAEIGYRMIADFPDIIGRGKHASATGLLRPGDAA